ncbi:MarR family winged helix-turn-helix transcriptional regulator [Microbacterium sp. zg.B48]|uniref:MarR family winged helix-turn-helix transcriptional regulator n=1 Tax=unclassified Microbacterium TaxID=2609290 RepID=UPI00214BBD0B|nr:MULTISPECIES: MarR family winged helix-turn-helix transcriptional regulator [unclassified Microbacterium]MCR2765095.1 MarR family winged helix-turn-helix transcriptional regulator [Microbacterium sp. zg.B48]MCR2811271.1 MarR family winged helix-turn-helix transcriptional regulator [Microbacterium sp. zg.B185]WIM19870.1 MarR family winged helix-turn-helix transcriptional regulator [Microbacterium sp. zg-B185]
MTAELRLAGELNRLSQLLARPFLRHYSEKHAISLAEWRALVQIVDSPGITATEICSRTGLTAMNVSRAVHVLRTAGRVTGDRDPHDSRRNLLTATAEGRTLFDELAPSAERDIRAIMSVLNRDELAFFEALVTRVAAHADRMQDP